MAHRNKHSSGDRAKTMGASGSYLQDGGNAFSLTDWLGELNKIKHAKTLSAAAGTIRSDQYIELTCIMPPLEELTVWPGWEQRRLEVPRVTIVMGSKTWTLETWLSEFVWPRKV